LRSTRSSGSSPADEPARPSRAALAILVFVSLAIPAGGLALIVSHDNAGTPARQTTPNTDAAAIDSHKARVGTMAPDFTLHSTDGRTVTLSALRGRPVVVAFFASWCHPCEEELPVLERFRRDNDALQVVGVSYQDLSSDTQAFVRRLRVTFPALVDAPASPVAQRYGVRGIPQTIFVDARGVVRGRVYGETSRRALQPAISDLLAGKNIRPL
jgi:cytochrome c biogenesis protein CcmG/thiol:disulfide interchange protein DsbE